MGRLLTFGLWGSLSLVFVVTSILGLTGMLISNKLEGRVIIVLLCLIAVGGSILITIISEIYLLKSKALTAEQKHILNNTHPVTAFTYMAYNSVVRDILKQNQNQTAPYRFSFLYSLNKYFITGYIIVCIVFVIVGSGMHLYK